MSSGAVLPEDQLHVKLGDEFISKAINDLPTGVRCPFNIPELDCSEYFSKNEQKFEIIDMNNFPEITLYKYGKFSPSNSIFITIRYGALKYFLKKGMWKYIGTNNKLYINSVQPSSSKVKSNGGKRKSKRRKTRRRKTRRR